MKKYIKTFEELTTIELYELLKVRASVFVVEQDCVYQDLDGIDYEAMHLFYEEAGEVVAYLRLFWKDRESGILQMGRVLTTKRGEGLGEQIVNDGIRVAKERLNAKQIYIEAQCYAIGFYERAGFEVTSEEFLEDGIPHVQMLNSSSKTPSTNI